MKAMILAGGRGTRLQPFTFSIPKPLLPVGEVPLLQLVVERLKESGIDEIILSTGYQAELIRAFCGDGSRFGVSIEYVHEEEPLGTAGALSLAKGLVAGDDRFVVMNGDILTQLDFGKMIAFSEEHDFELTIGYRLHASESPFGVLTIEGDHVTGIVEKPRSEEAISTGIYVLAATALDVVPDREFFTMPQLMSELIAAGRTVGAYHVEEFWLGLETVAKFEEALRELDGAAVHEVR